MNGSCFRRCRSVAGGELAATAAIDPDGIAAPAPVVALAAARVAELARQRHVARAERQAADVATADLRFAAHDARVVVRIAGRIAIVADREAAAAAARYPDA